MFRLILLSAVQVTKSSMLLVTRKLGSWICSTPTRTWPCSTILVAAWTVSAMRNLVMTTGNRRLARAETVTLCSTLDSFDLVWNHQSVWAFALSWNGVTHRKNAHVIELVQKKGLVFSSDLVIWWKQLSRISMLVFKSPLIRRPNLH